MKKNAIVVAFLFCWVFAAEPGRVIDGDTAWMKVHTYPREYRFERIRLLGVQTPEEGKPGYAEAKFFTKTWLEKGEVRLAVCGGDDKSYDNFGRLLATVTRDGEDLGQLLLNTKTPAGVPLAVPWRPK